MMVAKLPQGFLVRRPTMDDVESIVALLTTDVNSVNYIGYTGKDLQAHWETKGFNKETDAWLVMTSEKQIVGYAFMEGESECISIACEHPEYRGQGIWVSLFEYVEERVRQNHSNLPANTHLTLSTAFNDANSLAKNYMEQKGYKMIHRAWLMGIEMGAKPSLFRWAEGISVRTFIPGMDEHSVHEAVQNAFQLAEPFEEWESKFIEDIFDPTLWFLALDGDKVAGVALCYNNDPNMGWVWSLGVQQQWRHRGIGQSLLQYAFSEFYRREQNKVGLDVNAENSAAIQLYLNAGMCRVQEYYTYQKEIQ